MKPQDLRIGCFVKLKDSGDIVRITAITKRKIGFHYGSDTTRMYYRKYSEIEPILIYDHWRKIDCRELEWRDVWHDEKWYKYYIMSVYKTIRFIHELQNIHHALTGEELNIEL